MSVRKLASLGVFCLGCNVRVTSDDEGLECKFVEFVGGELLLISAQTNSANAIKQAQALATDLITSFEVDAGNSALFIGQSVFQILGTIITLAGVLVPLPKGVGSARPLPNVEPKPPEDVAALYGLVPGITISGVAGVWERFQNAATDEQAKVGDLELVLVALQNNVSAIIEAYNDLMFWDAAGADDLM